MKKYISTAVVDAEVYGGSASTSYRVRDSQGNITFISATEFRDKYTACEAMTFSEALAALKLGKHITRPDWGSAQLSLLYPYAPHPDTVAGSTPGTHTNPYFKAADNNAHAVGTMTTYIAMKTADNKLVPWAPTHLDLLATDWVL